MIHFLKRSKTYGAFALTCGVLLFYFQNCADAHFTPSMTTGATALSTTSAVQTGTLTVGDNNNSPPLDLFFIVDNSASMQANNANLQASFANIFKSNQNNISNFNTRIFLFNTNSTYSSSLTYPSYSPEQLTSSSMPSLSNYALGQSSTLGLDLASIPGGLFSVYMTKDGNGGNMLLPAPVYGVNTTDSTLTPSIYLPKGDVNDPQYLNQVNAVTELFQQRLSYLNPYNLGSQIYQGSVGIALDTSSALCTMTRILQHSSDLKFIQPGDAAAFIILSDDDDRLFVRNSANSNCQYGQGDDQKQAPGQCGNYSYSYPLNYARIQFRNSANFNFNYLTDSTNGSLSYNYTTTKTTPATCTYTPYDGYNVNVTTFGGYTYDMTYQKPTVVIHYTRVIYSDNSPTFPAVKMTQLISNGDNGFNVPQIQAACKASPGDSNAINILESAISTFKNSADWPAGSDWDKDLTTITCDLGLSSSLALTNQTDSNASQSTISGSDCTGKVSTPESGDIITSCKYKTSVTYSSSTVDTGATSSQCSQNTCNSGNNCLSCTPTSLHSAGQQSPNLSQNQCTVALCGTYGCSQNPVFQAATTTATTHTKNLPLSGNYDSLISLDNNGNGSGSLNCSTICHESGCNGTTNTLADYLNMQVTTGNPSCNSGSYSHSHPQQNGTLYVSSPLDASNNAFNSSSDLSTAQIPQGIGANFSNGASCNTSNSAIKITDCINSQFSNVSNIQYSDPGLQTDSTSILLTASLSLSQINSGTACASLFKNIAMTQAYCSATDLSTYLYNNKNHGIFVKAIASSGPSLTLSFKPNSQSNNNEIMTGSCSSSCGQTTNQFCVSQNDKSMTVGGLLSSVYGVTQCAPQNQTFVAGGTQPAQPPQGQNFPISQTQGIPAPLCKDPSNNYPVFNVNTPTVYNSPMTVFSDGPKQSLQDFQDFFKLKFNAIFGPNNSPTVAVIGHLANDNLLSQSNTTESISYEAVATSGATFSITQKDYSSSLGVISSFIKKQTLNNFLIQLPAGTHITAVSIKRVGTSQAIPLDNSLWSVAGSTLTLSKDAGAQTGDQLFYNFEH